MPPIRTILTCILLVITASSAGAQERSSPERPQAPDGATAHRDLAYVANGHERQRLDLYVPDDGEHLPLIIWVHGGAFRAGSKEDRVPLDYVEAGYAVASIGYRLSQHAIFPAQIEDVKAAVRWLRANAATYRLDPDRFGAWGVSAGGHLVAMLGTSGDVAEFETETHGDASSQVQAVVNYFGPTNFLKMDEQRIPGGQAHNTPDSPESQLIGGPIQEYPGLVARANPITFVSEDDPPFLIVHGDQDPAVPHGQSVLLRRALDEAGVPALFYTVKGGGHGGFDDPKVDALTKAFFEKHLKPSTR